jgi:hypothetical protein
LQDRRPAVPFGVAARVRDRIAETDDVHWCVPFLVEVL